MKNTLLSDLNAYTLHTYFYIPCIDPGHYKREHSVLADITLAKNIFIDRTYAPNVLKIKVYSI